MPKASPKDQPSSRKASTSTTAKKKPSRSRSPTRSQPSSTTSNRPKAESTPSSATPAPDPDPCVVWLGPPHARPQLVPLAGLRENPENPNDHSDEAGIRAIMASLLEFGQQKPTVHEANAGVMVAGNGTLEAARRLGWSHIWSSQTDLEGHRRDGFAIADNETARFAHAHPERTAALLVRIREQGGNIDATTYGNGRLAELLKDLAQGKGTEDGAEEDRYVVKYETPIYAPSGECPPVSELRDRAKTEKLREAILYAPQLDAEVRAFLLDAAERHTVFDYQRIADYYAHASREVQQLFEDSGLVIVDVGKAIENGFVTITDRMTGLTQDEIDRAGSAEA